jgi:hypothetical protein
MNRKLAIFGFSIIWIATIVGILFVMLPKSSTPKSIDNSEIQNIEKSNDIKSDTAKSDGDSFFYDKKVFVRHKKNDSDSTQQEEKVILVRKNIFFKPPSLKIKPVIKEVPKKKDNSDFDIKPVPTN